ncbi:hypothetical protein Asp14428_38870 [Actinoplanes sp. NBRC 14428]|uniref:Uncharacterized protein n=1 Tax=Pseudosporangium ferrugineum TaxID=439699 RepID=A0A2T0RML1_9ACTN|nr:hypothetical protein [Pseudosporangium ferrugineum]PRY22436.1 hypothetical protein CLV70_117140 [Pseudosporangium ferrugineum]BCJ52412.1 hypothetical protein Asp14428_38870 [Actinoplanes sp. NBRC 14428]
MSDVEEDFAAPGPLATHYLTTLEEAVEHLRAADLLGFGVQLRSYLETTDGESFTERWKFEIFAESPVEQLEAETEE